MPFPIYSSSEKEKPTPVKKRPCCSCDCCCEEETYESKDGYCPTSDQPIFYGTGEIAHSETDLSWSGFGFSWSQIRSYSNVAAAPGGVMGSGWYASALPYIVGFVGDSGTVVSVVVVDSASASKWFRRDLIGGGSGGGSGGGQGSFAPEFGTRASLAHESVAGEWILTGSDGHQMVFYDFSEFWESSLRGTLRRLTNPLGRNATVNRNAFYDISVIVFSDGSVNSAEFQYAYHEEADKLGLLKSITLVIDGTPIRRAVYDYWVDGDDGGSLDRLRGARIEQNSGDEWHGISETLYRYYPGGGSLKQLVMPNGFHAMGSSGILVHGF